MGCDGIIKGWSLEEAWGGGHTWAEWRRHTFGVGLVLPLTEVTRVSWLAAADVVILPVAGCGRGVHHSANVVDHGRA